MAAFPQHLGQQYSGSSLEAALSSSGITSCGTHSTASGIVATPSLMTPLALGPPVGFVPSSSNPRGPLLRIVGPAPAATATAAAGKGPVHHAPPTAVGVLAGLQGEGEGAAGYGYEGGAASLLVGLRLGDFGGRVGLLPGLRPRFMDRFAPPNAELQERKRRAPREDLTGYTAEEKVARRNERARIYTCQARQRQEDQQRELEKELVTFRLFASMVEHAPHMGLLVLRADLHAVVLFASDPLERMLGLRREALLGEPLWQHMHPQDHARLAGVMGDLILTLVPPTKGVRCRLRRAGPPRPPPQKRKGGPAAGAAAAVVKAEGMEEEWVWATINLRNGTQGLVCSVWPDAGRR